MPSKKGSPIANRSISKAPTGITGLDELTFGGFPAGRPTLVCGAAGSGKTLLAAEFLIHGATDHDEPGILVTFEETAGEMASNLHSLGFDLDALVKNGRILIDHVHIEKSEVLETGDYDLEGLFIRIGYAVDSIGAKRIVLDTIEALFVGLTDHGVLRSELRRLFRWLKDRGMTAVITAERGENTLTRYGIEEYVADCVILLDQRVQDQVATRRLRVVKYRGSKHGTNEYPFLIGGKGITVMPVTSLKLEHSAPTERVSTGVQGLDDMLGGKGVFRGSSVLISGSPGTGKSSIGMSFSYAACARGEKALIFSYEESPDQLIRNMASVGMDLGKYIKKGLLKIHSARPSLQGLEQHLLTMHDIIDEFGPSVVLVDPISNLTPEVGSHDLKPTLLRLIDMIKSRGITAFYTTLTSGNSLSPSEESEIGVSSLMDTWLLLRNVEYNGERNRTLFVLKSRGMAHSNQVREFIMSSDGIDLVDVYVGPDQVFTGAARAAQEALEKSREELARREHQRRLRELRARQKALLAQIAALEAEAAANEEEVKLQIEQADQILASGAESQEKMSRLRRGTGRVKKRGEK